MNLSLNDYSEILTRSRNIILRGAPGTGKTYLARNIATYIVTNGKKTDFNSLKPEQKEQIGFVQFHPSYDYTDFVEGLRPVLSDDGTMGFELREGIFKEFVKIARKNFEDSEKAPEVINKELQTQSLLEKYLDSIKFGSEGKSEGETTVFELERGNTFHILDVHENYIYAYAPNNPVTRRTIIYKSELEKMLESNENFTKVIDIRRFLNFKYTPVRFCYSFSIFNEIIKFREGENAHTIEDPISVEKVEKKQYIFIIDEINRGEISKIFGELFFSMDPGYRGKSGEITTQYASLYDSNEKFYIPDNVYIIGTMNDIDRSVDSFDFAMRRRFRFIEIKASDSIHMLGDNNDAIDRMKRLNAKISEIEGLNDNYHIGASYFLNYNKENLDELWKDFLKPLLQDYIRGMHNEKNILHDLKNAFDGQQ